MRITGLITRLGIQKFEVMKFVANQLGLGAPENLSAGNLRRLESTADQLLDVWQEPDFVGDPAPQLDGPFNKLSRDLDEIQKKVQAQQK
jgi:hypothetical protein